MFQTSKSLPYSDMVQAYEKAIKVIRSCRNVAQLVTAGTYSRLVVKRFPLMARANKDTLALVFVNQKSYIKKKVYLYGSSQTPKGN